MMREKIERELERLGRTVTLYTKEHPEGVSVKAQVQPMREKGAARAVPTPLGWTVQDKLIYIGPAGVRLDGGGCRMAVDGTEYRVRTAQPVYVGGERTHWWAVLERAEREVL